MAPEVPMRTRAFPLILGCALVSVLVVDTAPVWARASSGGSRGTRSYSTPASPSSPSSPSRVTPPPSSAPAPVAQPQRPGMFGGGLMGGIAGFALGGLLGSMLFGGMGGGIGGGVGLLEVLLG